MSDESDETRRFSPGDDAAGPPDRRGRAADDPDATRADDVAPDVDAAGDSSDLDATQVDGAPAGDDTLPDQDDRTRVVPPVADDPTVVQDKLGSTAVIPPVDDDWAPSRANPAWSGRAEVRPPQPAGGYGEPEWPTAAPRQRDRWWMPIVVGIIALFLLAVLGWAIWLIVRDTEDEQTPAPAPTTSSTPSAAPTTTATSSTPSSSPTTTSASPSPSPTTPSPTPTDVQIPALRGLSLSDAQVALRSTGLNYRLIYRQAPGVPAGTVIDSEPVEGQEVPPDTTITLVIAAEATSAPTEPTEEGGDDQN